MLSAGQLKNNHAAGVHEMNLVPVETKHAAVLYQLLNERRPEQSVHFEMPSWDDHVRFVAAEHYEAWYLVEVEEEVVGSVYLSREDEIGVFIFSWAQGKQYGPWAVELLMEKHPRTAYLANINPVNAKSIRLFSRLGFRHIQQTYELRR